MCIYKGYNLFWLEVYLFIGMTYARREIFDIGEAGFYHCIARCVRRSFLCGFDRYLKKSFEHRKEWVKKRLAELVDIFSIECVSYAVMSNHLHSLLHNRPDIAEGWSSEEVARRWRRLFPKRWKRDGDPEVPSNEEIKEIVSNAELVEIYRNRLCDISWFNRCLNENIARRANAEDECTGRFWEGRFKCQRLEGEAAVLACSVYIDLNPIRAGTAKTLEESDFTSIQDRIRGVFGIKEGNGPSLASHELVIEGGPSVEEYIELVEETGRMIVNGKHEISDEILPIIERLNIKAQGWADNARRQSRLFRRVIGEVEKIKKLAASNGKNWFQGLKSARLIFA